MADPPIDQRHKPHFHRVAAIKEVCDAATTANITLSGEQTIDGVTTSSSRVLVKDQSTGSQNGIWRSGSGAWTRAYDFSTDDPRVQGCIVPVAAGTANGSTVWQCTNTTTPTIGSTSIAFQDVTGGSASNDMVPYQIDAGETFTVPTKKQANYAMDITIDPAGYLDVVGYLLEVS